MPLPLDRALCLVLDKFTFDPVTTRDADEFISQLRLQGYMIVPKVNNVSDTSKAGEAANAQG